MARTDRRSPAGFSVRCSAPQTSPGYYNGLFSLEKEKKKKKILLFSFSEEKKKMFKLMYGS